jgi:predicted GIY-YIG superfamily endonuclease
MEKQKYVYVLKCTHGKYYVGLTEDPSYRIEEHFAGDGSGWTQLYKPVKVLSVIRRCELEDEKDVTLKYMKKYGMDNVRGGPFSTLDLPDSFNDMIKQLVVHTEDACYKCGSKEHYGNNCRRDNSYDGYTTTTLSLVYGNKDLEHKLLDKLIDLKISRYGSGLPAMQNQDVTANACFRCGREGHFTSSCYAHTHIDGRALTKSSPPAIPGTELPRQMNMNRASPQERPSQTNSLVCFTCGRPGHASPTCFATTTVDGTPLYHESRRNNSSRPSVSTTSSGSRSGQTIGSCFRCGHSSHYANECFASRDRNGDSLKSSRKRSREDFYY